MKLITHLGGYNNRPSEKPTGPQPVWIGLRRMLDTNPGVPKEERFKAVGGMGKELFAFVSADGRH